MQPAKLKLIYVVTQGEWGGAQAYVFDLATALKDEFDITVASGAEGSQELIQKCKEADINTHTFKNLVREINPLKDIAAIFELAQFFKKEQPSIVHLNSSKASLISTVAKKFLQPTTYNLKPKLIYTAHGWVFNEPLPWWRKKLYVFMERVAGKIHDRIITLSQYDYAAALKNKICDQEKLAIIPHGINPISFLSRDEARAKLNSKFSILNSPLWIITIANLYKTKGIEYLIDAAAVLKKEGVEPSFIIIGSGPERENLELRIKNYGLQNFYLIGSLPDAARYLKAFDLFVLPSVKEGLPYALLEAIQAGVPIIATNVGAIPEMLENETSGLLVPPADSRAIVNALKKFIDNQELRNNLSHATARQFQEKFNFDKMLIKTVKLYKY